MYVVLPGSRPLIRRVAAFLMAAPTQSCKPYQGSHLVSVRMSNLGPGKPVDIAFVVKVLVGSEDPLGIWAVPLALNPVPPCRAQN